MDKRSITAWLLGCAPDELMSFSEYDDHVAVISPAGQKFTFDQAQLEKGEQAITIDSKERETTRKKTGTRKLREVNAKDAKETKDAKSTTRTME